MTSDACCCTGDERNRACLAGFYFVVPGRQQKKTETAPSPLEVAESVAPVSWLVRTTTAPRKAAPDGSSTNPVKAPVEDVWLRTWLENQHKKRHCQQECRASAMLWAVRMRSVAHLWPLRDSNVFSGCN